MSWEVATFTALALVLIGGFAWYERAHPSARLVALVAVLTALAVAGRLVLAPVPNVVATTDIALITGYALGPAPGFAVGALAAPISNIWLGQGPWTLWQMAGWGLVGLAGAWLALLTRRHLGRLGLAAACGIAGLAYGALLDLSVMVSYGGEQSLDRYLALSARGLPFNVAHALGNLAFALAAGPALVRMISRYRTRLEFNWHPAGALPLALLAVLLIAPSLTSPPAADAERSTRAEGVRSMRAAGVPSAERWLFEAQRPDGGFAASLEFDSSPAMTGWVMMGLEAVGENPLDIEGQAPSPVAYLRSRVDRLRSTNDLERTILALEGAGVDSRDFAGVDLAAQLRSRRDGDGSIGGQVNLTAFFVLAMKAAGSDAAGLARSAAWLREAQNRDGGWGFNPGAPSDPDSTGAALQALAAAGSGGKASAAGVAWLRDVQRAGGGWGIATTGVVNAQSTAWAVQGLNAAGGGASSLDDGLAYLERLQAPDGHYRYSSASDQTPVWVTAQVLLAVERQSLPLAPVARAPKPAAGASAGSQPPAADAGSSPSPDQPASPAATSDRGGDADAGKPARSDGRGGSGGKPGGNPGGEPEAADASGAHGPSDEPLARTAAATVPGQPAPAAPADNDAGAGGYVAAGVGALVLLAGWLAYRRRRA